MASLVAINNETHLHLKVSPEKAERHGSELHLIPVVPSEFINLAVQYPIVLTKNGDTGQFVFAAMLGFETGENLFWQNEQWQGLYLPLHIRRQPFFVSSKNDQQQGNDEYAIFIDSKSPTIEVNSGEGERVFNDEGIDTEYFQQAKACLAQLIIGEKESQKLLAILQEMELIQTLSLEVTFADQHSTNLSGLYTIDEEKLAQVSDEQIVKLHKRGWLPAIYSMSSSLGQIHALIDLKNKKR